MSVLVVSEGEERLTQDHVLSLVWRVVSGQGPGPGVISVARPAPTADYWTTLVTGRL